MRTTISFCLAFTAALAGGCSSSETASDAALDAAADRAPIADSAGIDRAADARAEPDLGPCVPPTSGMRITASTALCAGEHALADPDGKGAIRIEAAGVELRCQGTVLSGGKRFASTDPQEIGIRIDAQDGVTVAGCAVRGYRFGLVATSSSKLTIADNDLSDNFTDEQAEWVFDKVQGGGIRLDGVSEATLRNNKLQRNFNGLDLRRCEKLTVTKNVVDHCANAAALVIDTHHSTFEANDFSWGIRGGLTYPDKWWGVDTKDSAGMLLEAGSSYNRIVDNDLTYGGDGLFLRAVLGACPHHNHVEGNDTSYSPHNAIESWCDDNTYINNKANRSHYGFWLGGSDRTIVRGNQINDNLVDGMSIQIGESRTMLIEDNEIKGNQRVGILATGREYQAWHNLAYWSPKLANASQYVIQRNRFADNARHDVFLTSIRGVLLSANSYGGASTVAIGKEALDVRSLSGAPTTKNQPPVAALTVSESAQGLLLDASASQDPEGQPLTYAWLVQPALTRFSPAAMPAVLLGRTGQAQETIAPGAQPGVYEVLLTVDDGELGGLAAAAPAYVRPPGDDLAEADAIASWSAECEQFPTCKTQISAVTDERVVGSAAIHVGTDAPYLFRLTRQAPAGGWDLNGKQRVGLFLRAHNPNGQGWQTNGPAIVLRSAAGERRLEPDTKWLAAAEGAWIYLEVPLAGSAAWTAKGAGLDLAAVTSIALEMDTFGWDPYALWLDGLSFY